MGRTEKPCGGMPKGDVKTSIPSGVEVPISWHLGYAHQGEHYHVLVVQ